MSFMNHSLPSSALLSLEGRYARALFTLLPLDERSACYEGLCRVRDFFEGDRVMFRFMIGSLLKRSQKCDLLNSLLELLKSPPYVCSFLKLLLQENRIPLLKSIIKAFKALFDESLSQHTFFIRHVHDVKPEDIDRLARFLRSFFGYKTVVLSFEKSPRLLAGFQVYDERYLIDLTLLSRIRYVQRVLQKRI